MEKLKRLGMAVCFGLCGMLGAQAQTQVIAHRGFWKTPGSAQNSITSLRKAAEAKVYGSEFDVHITSDGTVVVNHDNNIAGYLIADTPYKTLKKTRLQNGESLSTLKNYLKEGKKLAGTQLILEIKRQRNKELEDLLTRKVVEMVNEMGMQKQVEYISFSLNVCEQLVKLAPGSVIAYVNGDIAPRDLKEKGITCIDYEYSVLFKHPEWIKEAHELGMTVNGWTADKDKDLKRLIQLKVDFITTNNPLRAKELAAE